MTRRAIDPHARLRPWSALLALLIASGSLVIVYRIDVARSAEVETAELLGRQALRLEVAGRLATAGVPPPVGSFDALASGLEADHNRLLLGRQSAIAGKWPLPGLALVVRAAPWELSDRLIDLMTDVRAAGAGDASALVRLASAPGGPTSAALQAGLDANREGAALWVGNHHFALVVWLTVGFGLLLAEDLLLRRPRLERALLTVTALERQHQVMELNSGVDALTGLLSRRRVLELLHLEWRRAARYQEALTALWVVVDSPPGVEPDPTTIEAMLPGLGRSVRDAALRPGDQGGRFGPTTVLAVLPDTDVAGAALVAERVHSTARGLWSDQKWTVSIGALTTRPAPGTLPDAMLEGVRAAAAQAAADGGDRVHVVEITTAKLRLVDNIEG